MSQLNLGTLFKRASSRISYETLYLMRATTQFKTCIVIVAALAIAGGCATGPTAIPIKDPTQRIEFEGFSILPPQGEKWFVVSPLPLFETAQYSFAKDNGGRGVTATALAFLSFTRIDTVPAELRSSLLESRAFRAEMEQTVDTGRNHPVSLKKNFEEFHGAKCLRLDITAEDRGVPQFPGVAFILNNRELVCLHPHSPIIVTLVYSQRAIQGAPFLSEEGEGETFLNSLVFTAPPSPNLSPIEGLNRLSPSLPPNKLGTTLHPDEVAHYNLGNELAKKNDMDGAITEYRTALNLNPAYVEAHINLGNALHAKGDLERALAEFRTALRLNPSLAIAHNNLGNVLREKGDWEGASTAYRTALSLNPSYVEAHNGHGLVLAKQGDLEGAIAEYRTALGLNPSYVHAHYNLGIALADKGDLEGAITEYRTALILNPVNVNVHYRLGLALKAKGDVVSARKEFEEALRLTPPTPENQSRRKTIETELNQLNPMSP